MSLHPEPVTDCVGVEVGGALVTVVEGGGELVTAVEGGGELVTAVEGGGSEWQYATVIAVHPAV